MADIHDQIEQLYPDNNEELITPAALRQGLHALARLGPNQRPDLWKSVRFMTRQEATDSGSGGEVFEELDFTKCCTYSTVLVEFYRATPTSPVEYLVKLLCVFDGGPNPPYHVQRTGSFAENVTVPAKFVRADSLEAVLANIPFYKAGTAYRADDAVQYVLAGQSLVFLAKVAGKLPAPSAAAGDTSWQPVQAPVADAALFQRVTLAQLRQLRGSFKPGRLYVITGRQAADGTALADVRIRALTLSDLEPTGYLVESDAVDAPTVAVGYDLATDTTINLAFVPKAAVPVTYSQLTAHLAASDLVAGSYYQLTDYVTTWTDPQTSQALSGTPEALFLLATSGSTLAARGFSAVYPQDDIYYQVANTSTVWTGATKGVITRRVDTRYQNDIALDFRAVVFPRWKDAAGAYTVGRNPGDGSPPVYLPLFSAASYSTGRYTKNTLSLLDVAGSKLDSFNLVVSADSFFYSNAISGSVAASTLLNKAQMGNNQLSAGASFSSTVLDGALFLTNKLSNFFFSSLYFKKNARFQFNNIAGSNSGMAGPDVGTLSYVGVGALVEKNELGAFANIQAGLADGQVIRGCASLGAHGSVSFLPGHQNVLLLNCTSFSAPDGATNATYRANVLVADSSAYDDSALKARLGQTTASDPAAPLSLVNTANIKATATAYYTSLNDGTLRGFTSVDAVVAAYHQEALDTGGLAPAADGYAINLNNAPLAMRTISASYIGDAFRFYGTTNNPITLAIASGKTVSVNTCRYVSFTGGAIKPYLDRLVTLTVGRTDNLELEFLSGTGALVLDSHNIGAWTNPTGKAVTVTLTGTSTVPPAPAGVTVVDNTVVTKSAGNGGASVFTYAALRYESATKLTLDQYRYGIPLTLVLPNSDVNLAAGGGYFTVPTSGFYGIKGHVHLVFPNTGVYAEALLYTNGDARNIIAFSEIVPRDLGNNFFLGSEPIATDVYLLAGTTVHLGYSDSSAGGMYPRSDAPPNSCKLSIIRFA